MSNTVRPFQIETPQAALDDLQQRLALTRFPGEIPGSDWGYGTNLDYLRELVAYWRESYDWRTHEARLNQLPQFLVWFQPLRSPPIVFQAQTDSPLSPLPSLSAD